MEQAPTLDWSTAVSLGRQLMPPGPELGPVQIRQVVAELHLVAERALEPIADVTLLQPPGPVPVLVIDRSTWVAAIAESAQVMLAELAPDGSAESRRAGTGLRAKALGAQAGAVLAVVGSRILGQFDPFVAEPRLLLVAPNVVSVERRLGVRPTDFRMWVCLHEQTHNFQFANAPWLRPHLLGLFNQLLDGEDSPISWPTSPRSASVRDLIGDEQQRDLFDRITAAMSLLEGHADVMMDRVGEQVVPSYRHIRKQFEAHRDSTGLGSWIGRLIGLDLKRAQYRDGAEFCRQVIDAAGVPTLNRAFAEPALLPSLTELHEPQLWLHRL